MLLKKRIAEPYSWAHLESPLDDFLYKLSLAEDEESTELYLFGLYLASKEDFDLFTEAEKQRVGELLEILIRDTREHEKMLGEILAGFKEKGALHAEDESSAPVGRTVL